MNQFSLKETLTAITFTHCKKKSKKKSFVTVWAQEWSSPCCVWVEDWEGRVWGAAGAGRSCVGVGGRGCGGRGGGQGGRGESCCLWRTGVRQWEEVQRGADLGASMWQGPGWRSWGPGCKRGTRRHAGPVLSESSDTNSKHFIHKITLYNQQKELK